MIFLHIFCRSVCVVTAHLQWQYREDEDEMRQVISSLIKLAPELGNVCESHTFMDGGANGDILQAFALQLVHLLDEEVKRKFPDVKVCDSSRNV